MSPYGRRRGDWCCEEFGPPSRIGKLKSKNRKSSRRLLHKQARNDVKKLIQKDKEEQ